MAKFSSAFDKNRIKASDPKIIIDHLHKVERLIRNWDIPEDIMFNIDEKGFTMGKSDRYKVICGQRGREMTPNLAEDGNREVIPVLEVICGDGTVLPPLIIYKGKHQFKA